MVAIDWTGTGAALSSNGNHPTVPTEPEDVRNLRLTPVSKIPMRPTHWAWDTAAYDAPLSAREGRIPVGSLVMLAGRAGIGKSQIACWLTARVTRGTLPGCWYGHPRAVVYAASEDSWSMTVAPRLAAAGADLDRVYRIDVVDSYDQELRLTLPLDGDRLEAAIADYDVAMVVMDPMLSLIDATVNDYRAKEVRVALEPLVRMADRTGTVLFALAHFNKSGTGDPLSLVAGSSAFGQLVRACLAVVPAEVEAAEDGAEAPEDLFVMSTIKNNLGRTNLPSLEYRVTPTPVEVGEDTAWVSRVDFTGRPAPLSVSDLLRRAAATSDREDEETRTERDEAAEWLLGYLNSRQGQAPRKDIIRAARGEGFSESTVKRAMKKAKIVTQSEGYPATSTWYLPEHAPKSGQLGRLVHTRGHEPTDPTGPVSDPTAESGGKADRWRQSLSVDDDPWGAP